ncbi:MAG: DUF1343 domain-containing protein, partial [Balneolaceae bacterium]
MKYLIPVIGLAMMMIACEPKTQPEPAQLKTGAEVLVGNNFGFLSGKNIGIITNHTATVGDRHIADILHEAPEVNV